MKNPNLSMRNMLKQRLALLAALIAGMLCAGVHAQVVVINPTGDAANATGFSSQLTQTVAQYERQFEQLTTEINTYQQMLSTVEGLTSGMSLLPNQLQQITDTDTLVQANCPGPAGGIVGSLMSGLGTLLGQQPITATQQQICSQIVKTQVDKYNITVTLLNQMNTYADKFKQIESVFQGVSSLADASRAANQAADYHNAILTQTSNWQAQINADDAIISTLQSQQDLLATRALKGAPSPLGTLIQAGTLAAALQIK